MANLVSQFRAGSSSQGSGNRVTRAASGSGAPTQESFKPSGGGFSPRDYWNNTVSPFVAKYGNPVSAFASVVNPKTITSAAMSWNSFSGQPQTFNDPNQPMSGGYWGPPRMSVDQGMLDGIRSLIDTQYASDLDLANQNIRRSQDLAGLHKQFNTNDTRRLGQNYWLQQAGVALEKEANAYQQGLMPQKYGMLDRDRQLAYDANNIVRGWLNYTDQTANQDRGFDVREFNNRRLATTQTRDQQIADMQSNAAASGNMGGGSNIRQRTQYNDAADREFAAIGIADDRSLATRDRSLAQNERDRRQADLALQTKLLSNDGQRLSLDESKRLLEIEARRQGLSSAELKLRYEQELQNLGLQNVVKVNDLAEAIARQQLQIGSINRSKAQDVYNMGSAFGAVTSQPNWTGSKAGWGSVARRAGI